MCVTDEQALKVVCCAVRLLCALAVPQDGLEGAAGDGDVQLDAAQLAEYRQLKAQADNKAGRLLQEKSALEAHLKVCWELECVPHCRGSQHRHCKGWESVCFVCAKGHHVLRMIP